MNSNASNNLISDEESADSGSQSSSFLNQLQTKLKKGLRPTSTTFTSSDGTVTVFKNQGSVAEAGSSIKSYGFVVDTKPDLSIGKVRNWLFISSQDVPNDLILIKNNKISHILSLLPGFVLNSHVRNIAKNHLVLDIYDEEGFNLQSPEISNAMRFINSCRESNDVILIHCNAGISRAPTTAIMYLMIYEELPFDEAFKLVKEARPTIKPNDGFLNQLRALNNVHNSP